jgi:hypothetical protein
MHKIIECEITESVIARLYNYPAVVLPGHARWAKPLSPE